MAADLMWRHDGNAAIEFALAAPMLLILLAAVVEIGLAAGQQLQVQAAVEAGILYTAKNGANNLAAIAQAVTSATGTPGIAASPAPVLFCGCPTLTGVISQNTDCTTVCPDKTPPGRYVRVSAVMGHQTIMSFLNLPIPATVTASSTVRVQ